MSRPNPNESCQPGEALDRGRKARALWGQDVAGPSRRLKGAHRLQARCGLALAGQEAGCVVDAFDPAQRGEHRFEVLGVDELTLETHAGHPIRRGLGGSRDHPDVLLGEYPCHVGEELGSIDRLDDDAGRVTSGLCLVPLDLDEPLAVVAVDARWRSCSRRGAPRRRARG